MVRKLPYIMGVTLGIFNMILQVTPDFIFIIMTILLETLGLLVYLLLFAAYRVTLGHPTNDLIRDDGETIPRYWECIIAFLIVAITPFFMNVSSYNAKGMFWMTAVFTHAYLLWELIFTFTQRYYIEIKDFGED